MAVFSTNECNTSFMRTAFRLVIGSGLSFDPILSEQKQDSLALHRITTLSDRCNRPPLAFASVSPKSAHAQSLSSWHKASLHLLQIRHLLTDRTTKPAMYNYYILYVQWQVTHTSIVQTVAMGNWMSTLPVRRLSLPLCRQVVVARSEKRWSVCPLTVKHIFVECTDFNDTRNKYFVDSSLEELFRTVGIRNVVDFIKEAHFYPCDATRKHSICYVATWLGAGWYCINTAKPILKLSWPSGRPIILVSCSLDSFSLFL